MGEPMFITTSSNVEFRALLKTRSEVQLRGALGLYDLLLTVRDTPAMHDEIDMLKAELRSRGLTP